MALNARQERFAVLVATGLVSNAEAAREAGYSPKVAPRFAAKLMQNGPIASRIETLRTKHQANASIKHDVTRDKVIAEVAKLALVTPEPAVPTPSEKLKALDQLSKLLGYNEPEKRMHEHTHIQVDASLIAQLREGYELTARERLHKACVLEEGRVPEGAQAEGRPSRERDGGACPPVEGQ